MRSLTTITNRHRKQLELIINIREVKGSNCVGIQACSFVNSNLVTDSCNGDYVYEKKASQFCESKWEPLNSFVDNNLI